MTKGSFFWCITQFRNLPENYGLEEGGGLINFNYKPLSSGISFLSLKKLVYHKLGASTQTSSKMAAS